MITFIRSIRAAGIDADQISRRKDGTVIVRRGFFYTHGVTAEKFSEHVMGKLLTARISAHVIENGEIWKPFNGGSSVARGSHWFVVLAENSA